MLNRDPHVIKLGDKVIGSIFVNKSGFMDYWINLPASDKELAKLIDSGYELASKMSWEKVVSSYVLPALDRACRRNQSLASA